MTPGLTIGSLFSGVGGLELGLERAGLGPVAWQVEREPYCRAVLAKHWPGAARFDDVCTVGAHNLPPVDVVCGGFPCQDISRAGGKVGIRGERSGLWSEYVRILRQLRPRYVVVENVADLLARGMGVVLGDLAESGYDAEWDCLPAAAVGAPHRRDRLFILAYPQCGGRGAQRVGRVGGPVGDGRDATDLPPTASHAGARAHVADAALGGRGPERPHASGCGATDGPSRGAEGARRGGPEHGGRWWAVEPDVGRVAHGVPARVDRLRALGNAVVPQVAEVVGRLIVAREEANEQDSAAA